MNSFTFFMNEAQKKFLADVVFWSHLGGGIFWYGLFLVPTSWWPEKITFHFFFTLAIVGHQFLWGLVIMPWSGRYRTVCALTTFLQLLRGKKISDPENYDHSFTLEFIRKFHIRVPHWVATAMNFGVVTLVSIQYFSR